MSSTEIKPIEDFEKRINITRTFYKKFCYGHKNRSVVLKELSTLCKEYQSHRSNTILFNYTDKEIELLSTAEELLKKHFRQSALKAFNKEIEREKLESKVDRDDNKWYYHISNKTKKY